MYFEKIYLCGHMSCQTTVLRLQLGAHLVLPAVLGPASLAVLVPVSLVHGQGQVSAGRVDSRAVNSELKNHISKYSVEEKP